jgi:hypothetical protein
MADVICRKCGEPWDSWGVRNGDMDSADAGKFLRGEGCPSCGFGSKCVACSGTGKARGAGCRECRGEGYVIVRRMVQGSDPKGVGAGGYWTGYRHRDNPTFRGLTEAEVAGMVVLEHYGQSPCLEGRYESLKVACWHCAASAPTCSECGGSGKFSRTGSGGDLAFLESLDDAFDGDEAMDAALTLAFS